MAYENLGESALDYLPCRYGKSKTLFRGPKRKMEAPYVAVLGGTETYGKFMDRPFAALAETAMEYDFVNLGCVNAGIDVFANDQTILDICARAAVTVIQLPGAQNMSNRFYAVHPRRNDRFLRASNLLKTIYREVDFTEFNFTRHLLKALHDASEDKFAMVVEELKDAWVARMKGLISRIEGKVVLLWLADHAPGAAEACDLDGRDPLFVDETMINALRPFVAGYVEVAADGETIQAGQVDLVYSDIEAPAATEMLGTAVHEQAATALQQAIAPLI